LLIDIVVGIFPVFQSTTSRSPSRSKTASGTFQQPAKSSGSTIITT